MPSGWLNVPHFRQELEYSCVAACARMVLAHHNDIRSEADLRLLLATQPTGTRAGNLVRLAGPAFEVYLRPSNLVELETALADNQPPLAFLKTGSLETGLSTSSTRRCWSVSMPRRWPCTIRTLLQGRK